MVIILIISEHYLSFQPLSISFNEVLLHFNLLLSSNLNRILRSKRFPLLFDDWLCITQFLIITINYSLYVFHSLLILFIILVSQIKWISQRWRRQIRHKYPAIRCILLCLVSRRCLGEGEGDFVGDEWAIVYAETAHAIQTVSQHNSEHTPTCCSLITCSPKLYQLV